LRLYRTPSRRHDPPFSRRLSSTVSFLIPKQILHYSGFVNEFETSSYGGAKLVGRVAAALVERNLDSLSLFGSRRRRCRETEPRPAVEDKAAADVRGEGAGAEWPYPMH
jgi:hypothetical protein